MTVPGMPPEGETPDGLGSSFPRLLRFALWADSWVPWIRLMMTVIILTGAYLLVQLYGG